MAQWIQYDQTAKLFKRSIDNGASFQPLELSASQITTGTFPESMLPIATTANAGMVSTIAQNFAGDKGFAGNVGVTGVLTAYGVANFNNVINTIGGQIQFPATQNPSSGPNILDDYEEGSWTPTITGDGGAITSYTSQAGLYIKIGRLVWIGFYIQVNVKGGTISGNLKISGVPIGATPFGNTFGSANIGGLYNWPSLANIYGYLYGSNIILTYISAGYNYNVVAANAADGCMINGTCMYMAAA